MPRRSLQLLLACAAITFAATGRAETSDAEYQLEIARQPIAATLEQFSRQTGLYVSFVTKDADKMGLMVGPLKGRYTLESALTELLAKSGLTFTRVNSDTIAVTAASSAVDRRSTSTANDGKPHLQNLADRRFLDDGADDKDKGPGVQRVAAVGTEEAPRGSAARGKDSGRMEEVVVTATKRVERLIDVPQSATVVSSDNLMKLGASQLRDFSDTIAGLSIVTQGAGFTQISLRGVTAGVDIGSTVGIYVDEVPYGSSTLFGSPQLLSLDVGLFDLDRVEVLRGPQGTLYGASTMGGLIKYVTNRPDATDFGADVQTGISGTKDGGVSYNGAMAINAPIAGDKAAVRVSGFYSRDGGYIDNVGLDDEDVNSSDIYGGRADFLFAPTDALSIRLAAFAQNITRDGEGTADNTLAGPPLFGELEQERLAAEDFSSRFRLVSGTVTYDFGPSELTSITSYQEVRVRSVQDQSRLLVPLAGFLGLGPYGSTGQLSIVPTDKFTQELRLASTGTPTLEWLIGGYYTDEKTDGITEYILRDPSGNLLPNDFFSQTNPARYEEEAAFGDLTWHLTDKFDVTGGVRYAESSLKFEQNGGGLLGSSQPSTKSSENVFTYLANARYHFGDNATGYVRYATGYRPGGPNFVTRDPTTGEPLGPATYDADELKSYEVGYKAQTADGTFGLDAAVYYIDWQDIHISAIRGGFGFITNATGGAEVRGTELTLTASPVDGLQLTGAFAYQDAQMSEADADLQAAEGERLPNVPRFTGAVAADYQLPYGSLQPTLGFTVRHMSDRMTSFDAALSRPQYRVPEYTSVDLRAGITVGAVACQLLVRNVFDERGQLSASATNLGTARAALLQPRTIGLTASMKF